MQQQQAPTTIRCFGEFLNPIPVKKLTEWIVRSPNPNHHNMAHTLAELENHIEKTATALGKIEVVSDQDRKKFRDFSVEMFKAVERLDQNIRDIKALPKNIGWGQQACAKLEHITIRLEDIAETAALASSKKFAEIILTEIQNLKKVSG